MPFASTNGIEMHYERRGDGAPLLLIMGYGTSAALWGEPFLARLAAHFDLIVPDNRGTGRSEKPRGPVEIATLADDLAGQLTALHLESAHVFGVSMGGMIAQELVLRHPERVRSLILGCTHAGGKHALPADPAIRALIAPQPGRDPREAIEGIYAAMTGEATRETRGAFLAEITERMLEHPTPGHVLRAQAEAVSRYATWERLAGVQTPTLVITGDRDQLCHPENSSIIAERVPGARLVVLPGVAHNFHWEAEQTTVELLRDFIPVTGTE